MQAGFVAIAHYHSALCTDLGQTDPRLARVTARLAAQGVTWRSLTAAELATAATFELLLQALHPLIHTSFRRNFLFTPLSQHEFSRRYQPLRAYLRPELCWLATAAGQAVGFLLALPDYSQGERAGETLVVKTLAVRPGRTYAGLGALLLARSQQQAQQLGYRRAIHALMHTANPSRCLSDRYAEPWRRYVLLSRQLANATTGSLSLKIPLPILTGGLRER
ncbi:MAG: GNAT family N-acetyltransferase [Spirulinaceae cyanobacterium RM2_2_10]|nr:GNAT family N-acetyltransferase [Spirulinaceae cyanobacterium RM2_2_10]